MPATSDSGRLALAKAKFSRVAQELDRLSEDINTEHGRPAVLKPRGPLQQTAGNMYSVRYSLQQPKEAQLALTFIIIGEDADLLLLQGQEQSGLRDARSDPGQVDQRVYSLRDVEAIKTAVKEKIMGHLRARAILH